MKAVAAEEPKATAPASIAAVATRSEASGPVLVAEDNARLQRLLKLQFDDLGVPVTFVSDGLAVVEVIRAGQFAMVFKDCEASDGRLRRNARHPRG